MTTDRKTRWLAALRSGNYLQGRTYLKFNSHYCCLGVLLDTIDPNAWKAAPTQRGCLPIGKFWNTPACVTAPPEDIIGHSAASMLTTLNDVKNQSFFAIADFIEEHLDDDLNLQQVPKGLLRRLRYQQKLWSIVNAFIERGKCEEALAKARQASPKGDPSHADL